VDTTRWFRSTKHGEAVQETNVIIIKNACAGVTEIIITKLTHSLANV
jgi:hypothetical protein